MRLRCVVLGFAVLSSVGVVIAGCLIAGCLAPSGANGLSREKVEDCVPPTKPLQIMHERADIEWPTAACRHKAAELLSKMSLSDKVGQMVQPDRSQLQNDHDVRRYNLGSVLNGGGTDPNTGNDKVSWANSVAALHQISLESEQRIPVLYGIDAVHGHNNVQGAVIFPHNIGLGCTLDPALMERIGRVVAEEVAATGIDWTFAPVLAAARDERWGRTYEAFGEVPELAALLGPPMIRGIQGVRLGQGEPSVLACAKHFAGDGGTKNGVDQGNTVGPMSAIEALHVSQYKPAVEAGVGSVMASFSSVNGVKMHCYGPLLTDVLKYEMGFNGFVVSDWEALQQLPGSFNEQVASAVNGGIDMVMAPKSYQGFVGSLESLVPSKIPEARIEDAVGRILAVKCELGMFDDGYFPKDSQGNIALRQDLLDKVGSKEHREVAREAVRKSLVLLKNDNRLLPLGKELPRIHVAGRSADDLGNQCGGWTISWQGSVGDLTTGTTVLEAIKQTVSPTGMGTEVTYSEDGSGAEGAGAAVVVIGEKPYAEGNGDRKSLSLYPEDVAAITRIHQLGIPVVVILMSGRPMILGVALTYANAFIAAWLPGTEGQGVADVLFGDYAPTGKLGHSWPRSMEQIPINVGDKSYDPLFPFGFGLTYDNPTPPAPAAAPVEPVQE